MPMPPAMAAAGPHLAARADPTGGGDGSGGRSHGHAHTPCGARSAPLPPRDTPLPAPGGATAPRAAPAGRQNLFFPLIFTIVLIFSVSIWAIPSVLAEALGVLIHGRITWF
ncbi:unnamed protein product [Coccothraustes coccothraustes]